MSQVGGSCPGGGNVVHSLVATLETATAADHEYTEDVLPTLFSIESTKFDLCPRWRRSDNLRSLISGRVNQCMHQTPSSSQPSSFLHQPPFSPPYPIFLLVLVSQDF